MRRMLSAVAALAASSAGHGSAFLPARVEVLENGFTLVMRPDRSRPLVAFCTHVDGGSRTERDAEKGLSHYYEHIVFRGGTKRQAELETRKTIREIGDFGGYTTEDHTTYYLVVPSDRLDQAFWRYADALTGLEVTADKIERDRQSVIQEHAMRVADSPSGRAWARLWAAAFTRHPYATTPIGRLEVIANAGLDAFRTFYEERYVPNQMVMAVVGDFDPEDVLRRVKDGFGRLAPGRASFELGLAEPEQREWREVHETARSALVYGALGFKVPEFAHPETAAIRVADALLTDGGSSRLERALRQAAPLVADLWSDPGGQRDPGLWTIGFSFRPENEERAMRALLGALGALARDGAGEDELARARALLERDERFGGETFLAQAVRLADHAVKRALPLEPRSLADLLEVDAAAVREVLARRLSWAGATLVLVRPEGSEPRRWEPVAKELLPPPAPARVEAAGRRPVAVRTLASGLTLAVETEAGRGVAALVAAVPGGQWLEGPGRWGASALLARTIGRGSAGRDEASFGAALDALGGRLQSEPGEDLTVVTLTAASGSFLAAAELFVEALLHPRLDAAAVDRAREEARAELKALGDDSFRETHAELRRRLYGELAYSRPLVGEAASLAALGPAELGDLHARAFTPANIVLAAAGEFDPAALEALLARMTAGAARRPKPRLDLPGSVPETRRERRELARARSQSTFDFGRLVPGVGHPDAPALRIAARALGNRLFFRWVYEEGLAYRMWTRYPELLGPAPFYFEMGVDPARLRRALDGVRRDVSTAAREGLTAEEVESARASLLQGLVLDQQTVARRAWSMARYQALGLGADYVERLAGEIRAASRADVDRALRLAADPATSVLVVVGPPAHPDIPGLSDPDER